MAQDNVLNRDGCRSNSLPTKQPRNSSERKATDGAEVIAPASAQTASRQHGAKQRAMTSFMVAEVA
jgi:hypothetical protein